MVTKINFIFGINVDGEMMKADINAINDLENYLKPFKRDIHFYNGDVRKLAYELKQQGGKDIWICGGADIVQ